MSILTRQPKSPYRNLFFATVIGLLVWTSLHLIVLVTLHASSWSQAGSLIGDALSTSLIFYLAAALILTLYALPLMWYCLRLRVAGPAIAFSVAMLPSMCLLVVGSFYNVVIWVPCVISAMTGLCFVLLAYRGAPSINSFKPNPLRGSA